MPFTARYFDRPGKWPKCAILLLPTLLVSLTLLDTMPGSFTARTPHFPKELKTVTPLGEHSTTGKSTKTNLTIAPGKFAVNKGPIQIPKALGKCMEEGHRNMSVKKDSEKVLNCCSTMAGCACFRKRCSGKAASHDPECHDGNREPCRPTCPPKNNYTLSWCEALPIRPYFSRNPWIWLIFIASTVALFVLFCLCLVGYKKFSTPSQPGGSGSRSVSSHKHRPSLSRAGSRKSRRSASRLGRRVSRGNGPSATRASGTRMSTKAPRLRTGPRASASRPPVARPQVARPLGSRPASAKMQHTNVSQRFSRRESVSKKPTVSFIRKAVAH